MDFIKICLLVTTVLLCDGVSGINDTLEKLIFLKLNIPKRRYFMPSDESMIIGAPLYPHHLPEAEPILPGHTLIRPALGMLKSSVKFPHRELEDGSGVYGSYDNLGIKYDGKNERVMYTGFRRSGPWNDINPNHRTVDLTRLVLPLTLALRKGNKKKKGDVLWMSFDLIKPTNSNKDYTYQEVNRYYAPPLNHPKGLRPIQANSNDVPTISKSKVLFPKQLVEYINPTKKNQRSEQNDDGRKDKETAELANLIKRLLNLRRSYDLKEKNKEYDDLRESTLKNRIRGIRSIALKDPVQNYVLHPTRKKFLRVIRNVDQYPEQSANKIENSNVKKKLRTFMSYKESRPLRQNNNIHKNVGGNDLNKEQILNQNNKRQGNGDKSNLARFFHIIDTLRKDQEMKQMEPSGIVGFGKLSNSQYSEEEEEEVVNATQLFWDTQDLFNHVKFSQDAPDHFELMPEKVEDNQNNWGFFQQQDFTEFEK